MTNSILNNILILLALALVIGISFRALRLPQVLGYLVIGAVVGPHGLEWVRNVAEAHQLAGFGVVFLMFTVGLEFSFAKMRALHKAVILLGGLQVILCTTIGLATGLVLKLPWYVGLIVGGILSMSSTAITIKQLKDQFELNSSHGRNAVGILLFQDLAVIPFFILIGSLGVAAQHMNISITLLFAILKGVVAFIIILAIGRWLFRPLFHLIADTHVIELFTLAVLLVTLASAWLTQSLGLSFALGGFLAGMMLSETQFRHQIEVEIRPFRDVLLALFFITIGMLLNFASWKMYWPWILLLFVSAMLIKGIIIGVMSRILGDDTKTALRTSLVLVQGGEFGFALLTLGLTNKLFPAGFGQTILGTLLLSFAIGPILITYNQRIANFFSFKKTPAVETDDTETVKKKILLEGHVILCGYGRIGQNIAALLEQEHIRYCALDLDPAHIQEAHLAGIPAFYGDATHPQILEQIGLGFAKALVICFSDSHAALKVLQHGKNLNAKLPVIIRCRNEMDLSQLQGHGAAKIVVEDHETSLALIYHLMRSIHYSHKKVSRIIESIRRHHYELLHQVFPGSLTESLSETGYSVQQMRVFIVLQGSTMVNKSIQEVLTLLPKIKIISLRRGNSHYTHPHPEILLQAEDILILYGTAENLEKAEQLF